jgi:hypothetical protein
MFRTMLSERTRRVLAWPLALALAVGLVVHPLLYAVDTGAKAGTGAMDMSMAMGMSADMPMPNKCDGCAGDEKATMPAACAAFCGSIIALPLAPVVIDPIAIATLRPTGEAAASGHTAPPDPYPPKPVVLS